MGVQMNIDEHQHLEQSIIAWFMQRKVVDEAALRTKDLVEARIVDSMQFLDFVYFLSELCDCDVSARVKIDDLRSLERITSFVKINATRYAMRTA
jgi:hypothetical protein